MSQHDENAAQDRQRSAANVEEGTHDQPLTELKPPQMGTSDEAGDPSVMNADHPMRVREEVGNTSDSSGLRNDDEAKGELIKDQLKRGLTNVSPMD